MATDSNDDRQDDTGNSKPPTDTDKDKKKKKKKKAKTDKGIVVPPGTSERKDLEGGLEGEASEEDYADEARRRIDEKDAEADAMDISYSSPPNDLGATSADYNSNHLNAANTLGEAPPPPPPVRASSSPTTPPIAAAAAAAPPQQQRADTTPAPVAAGAPAAAAAAAAAPPELQPDDASSASAPVAAGAIGGIPGGAEGNDLIDPKTKSYRRVRIHCPALIALPDIMSNGQADRHRIGARLLQHLRANKSAVTITDCYMDGRNKGSVIINVGDDRTKSIALDQNSWRTFQPGPVTAELDAPRTPTHQAILFRIPTSMSDEYVKQFLEDMGIEVTSVTTITRVSNSGAANRNTREQKVIMTSKENVRKLINPGGDVEEGTIEIGFKKFNCDIFRDTRTGQCRDCLRWGHHGAACVYE